MYESAATLMLKSWEVSFQANHKFLTYDFFNLNLQTLFTVSNLKTFGLGAANIGFIQYVFGGLCTQTMRTGWLAILLSTLLTYLKGTPPLVTLAVTTLNLIKWLYSGWYMDYDEIDSCGRYFIFKEFNLERNKEFLSHVTQMISYAIGFAVLCAPTYSWPNILLSILIFAPGRFFLMWNARRRGLISAIAKQTIVDSLGATICRLSM